METKTAPAAASSSSSHIRDKTLISYELFIDDNKNFEAYYNYLYELHFVLKNNKWYLLIE